MYFVYSFDAYNAKDCNAKFANDAKGPKENAYVKKIVDDRIPRLFIMAKRNIKKDEEIRYDYGQPNAEWRMV